MSASGTSAPQTFHQQVCSAPHRNPARQESQGRGQGRGKYGKITEKTKGLQRPFAFNKSWFLVFAQVDLASSLTPSICRTGQAARFSGYGDPRRLLRLTDNEEQTMLEPLEGEASSARYSET